VIAVIPPWPGNPSFYRLPQEAFKPSGQTTASEEIKNANTAQELACAKWLQNAVYIAVGFLWLTWMGSGREDDDLTIRAHPGLDRYQLGSLVCALILLDNLLRKMGGPGESDWWWMALGRTEVILPTFRRRLRVIY
jgi:hypothetical protein